MKETPSVAVQGPFGRVAIHTTARALVEHAHLEFNFVFHIGGASTGFGVGKQDFLLDTGGAVLVNPWMPHAKLASEGGPTQVLTVLPETRWLASVLGLVDMPIVKLFSQFHVQPDAGIRALVEQLAAQLSTGGAFGDGAHEPMLRELVVALTDTYADTDMRATFHRRERPMDGRVSRSMRIIREEALRNPNLNDIAAQVGLSRSRFFQQFKACVGASPQQYLDWARMAAATRLLADASHAVAEVSDQLGFSAPSHFARFFAQHMGVPPGEFKRGVMTEAHAAGTDAPLHRSGHGA